MAVPPHEKDKPLRLFGLSKKRQPRDAIAVSEPCRASSDDGRVVRKSRRLPARKMGPTREPGEAGKAVRGTAAVLFPVAAAVPPEMETSARVGSGGDPKHSRRKSSRIKRLLFLSRAEGSPTMEGLCKKDAAALLVILRSYKKQGANPT